MGEEERFWFWTDGPPILTRAQASECVRFVDTVQGDVVACHPNIAGAFFLFPRDEQRLYMINGTFAEALEWLLTSGICLRPTRARFVEPLMDTHGLCWSGHWDLDGHRNAVPDFAETVAKIAALDARSLVVADAVDGSPIAQVFLPTAETRVRVIIAEYDGKPRFDLISFLAGPSREQMLASLRQRGFALVPA